MRRYSGGKWTLARAFSESIAIDGARRDRQPQLPLSALQRRVQSPVTEGKSLDHDAARSAYDLLVDTRMRTIVTACLVLAACAVADDARDAHDLAPIGQSGGGGAADGVCATVPAAIAPTNVPQYSCGALDAGNNALMTDLNAFWGSQVVACACGADFPNGCDGAFSLFDQGYIFIGQQFINDLATSSHSVMTAQYVYAHEFGHELEGHYGLYAATTQQRELTADCLAGYYLGSLICRGAATERDIVTTLRAACVIGDGTGNPITDLETHGTCEQRATSVAAGIDAYLTGQRPLDACAL